MGGDTMGMNNMINGAESTHIKDSRARRPLLSPRPLAIGECQTSGCASPSREGLPPPCLLLVVGASHDQLAVAQCG